MRPRIYDQRDRERFTAYVSNEAFYNGEPAAQLTVLSTAKRDEVRAVFNYAHDILNKHAAATINGLECHAGDATAQRELDAALRNSNSFATDFAAVLGACVDGDGAFYVSHVDGQVFYRDLHPGDVEVLDWRADGQPARVMVQFDDRIETWTPYTVEIETNSSLGSVLGVPSQGEGESGSALGVPSHGETEPLIVNQAQYSGQKSEIENPKSKIFLNPYGLIPIVLFRNWPRPGSRWGDSTIEHIKAACRLLNERIDLLMWLVRVQGNPPIKALGLDTVTLRTDPGEVWTAPADATIDLVKLLDAETAGIHISTINLLLQVVKELSNTPSIAYGVGSANLSGRALELAYMPLIQAAAIRRGYLSEAIRQRNRVILSMAQVLHGVSLPTFETSVQFAPVVPDDLIESRNQDRQDVQLGLLTRETYSRRYVA
jgi:hypothetical protein